MQIKITPNDKGNPPGKLADAEIYFSDDGPDLHALDELLSEAQFTLRDGKHDTLAAAIADARNALKAQAGHALDGLKLIGFSIWESRLTRGRNVTFPARQYAVNGERRSFALLRPINDATAQERIRELILAAYDADEYDAKRNTGNISGAISGAGSNPVTNPTSIVDAYASGLKSARQAIATGEIDSF